MRSPTARPATHRGQRISKRVDSTRILPRVRSFDLNRRASAPARECEDGHESDPQPDGSGDATDERPVTGSAKSAALTL
jgi:hypothetical protein